MLTTPRVPKREWRLLKFFGLKLTDFSWHRHEFLEIEQTFLASDCIPHNERIPFFDFHYVVHIISHCLSSVSPITHRCQERCVLPRRFQRVRQKVSVCTGLGFPNTFASKVLTRGRNRLSVLSQTHTSSQISPDKPLL